MERSAIRNGRVVKECEAVLPVTYREVQYSFSVYEALRVLGGHVVHLDDHLRRLAMSCSAINLIHPFSDGLIADSIESLIDADSIKDATMRILIVGGDSPLLFITYTDLLSYPASYYSDGIDCTLYHGERFLPEAKTSNLLMQYIALEEAKSKGAFESLLVNRSGLVLEGTRSNFYGLKGNKLYTAPDDLVLSGITRISVLKAAEALGIGVVYNPPAEDKLQDFDALFISSTSMGAMPVRRIDGIAMPAVSWNTVSEICRLERSWE